MSSINHSKDRNISCDRHVFGVFKSTAAPCAGAASLESNQHSEISSQAVGDMLSGVDAYSWALDQNGNIQEKISAESNDVDNKNIEIHSLNGGQKLSFSQAAVCTSESKIDRVDGDSCRNTSQPCNRISLSSTEESYNPDSNRNLLQTVINNDLSSTSSFDKLLRSESKRFGLPSHLSLCLTNATDSVTTRATSVLSKANWLSSHKRNIGALMSPTFSMADIAIIVPDNLQTDHSSETLFQLMEDALDALPQQSSAVQEGAREEKLGENECNDVIDTNTNDFVNKTKSEDEKVNNTLFPSCSQVNSLCDPLINGHDNQNKTKLTNFKTEENLVKETESFEFGCDRTALINNKNFSIINTESNSSCLKATRKSFNCDEIEDNVSEWQFVENTRSKQKRRHNQTTKATTSQPTSVPQASFNTETPRKQHDHKKKPLPRIANQLKSSSTCLSVQRSAPLHRQQSVKSDEITNALASTDKGKSVVGLADVTRVPLSTKAYENPITNASSCLQVVKHLALC